MPIETDDARCPTFVAGSSLRQGDHLSLVFPEDVFDNPIFHGVKRDDGEHSIGGEASDSGFQCGFDLFEFRIDGDPKGLKRAGCGMARGSAASTDSPLDDLGEACRCCDGGAFLFLENGFGDSTGLRFFSEVAKQLCEASPIIAEAGNPIRGGSPFGAVHSHIQRTLVQEREAAIGFVQLERGNAEIEQDAIEGGEAGLGSGLCEGGEIGMNEHGPIAVRGEAFCTACDRIGIAIQAEQSAVRTGGFEDFFCMTASAERAVQIATTGARLERFQCFAKKNGNMHDGEGEAERIQNKGGGLEAELPGRSGELLEESIFVAIHFRTSCERPNLEVIAHTDENSVGIDAGVGE